MTFDDGAGRHSSFSDGSSQNQMHLTPVLDQSDDILYDTDHYQDGKFVDPPFYDGPTTAQP